MFFSIRNLKEVNLFDTPNYGDYTLFCDLDGVLADIEASFRCLHPRFEEIPKRKLWDLVEARGVTFWETLPWTSDGKILWGLIHRSRPRILSAAPTRNAKIFTDSSAGKRLWIRRELGPVFKDNAIICRRHEKSTYAAAGSILIDDYPLTIQAWQNAGGIGILHVSARQTIQTLKRLVPVGRSPGSFRQQRL